jgi:hypothetical protein
MTLAFTAITELPSSPLKDSWRIDGMTTNSSLEPARPCQQTHDEQAIYIRGKCVRVKRHAASLFYQPRHIKPTVAADCTCYADPYVTEHNKTPVHALAASTGVIIREICQAVSLVSRAANSIALELPIRIACLTQLKFDYY